MAGRLDGIIWVTTPKKVGDLRGVREIRRVLKARTNFAYVVNKMDWLLAQSNTPPMAELGSGRRRRCAGRLPMMIRGRARIVRFSLRASIARRTRCWTRSRGVAICRIGRRWRSRTASCARAVERVLGRFSCAARFADDRADRGSSGGQQAGQSVVPGEGAGAAVARALRAAGGDRADRSGRSTRRCWPNLGRAVPAGRVLRRRAGGDQQRPAAVGGMVERAVSAAGGGVAAGGDRGLAGNRCCGAALSGLRSLRSSEGPAAADDPFRQDGVDVERSGCGSDFGGAFAAGGIADASADRIAGIERARPAVSHRHTGGGGRFAVGGDYAAAGGAGRMRLAGWCGG